MVDKAMGRLAILQIELELNSLVIRSPVNKQNSEHLVQELKNRLSAENFQRAGDGVDKIFFTQAGFFGMSNEYPVCSGVDPIPVYALDLPP